MFLCFLVLVCLWDCGVDWFWDFRFWFDEFTLCWVVIMHVSMRFAAALEFVVWLFGCLRVFGFGYCVRCDCGGWVTYVGGFVIASLVTLSLAHWWLAPL